MTEALEEIVRIEGGRVLAALIRMTGDFDLAEDAVQDATLAALEAWPRDGVPDNPAAWLTTVARRKALDRIRRESARRPKEDQAVRLLGADVAVGVDAPPRGASVVADDLLRLIFTCCHPALAVESQLALTLRTVCGMTTPEIAGAFLVAEPTMGQRISRAKRKIAVAQIPYRVPPDHELTDRLRSVLAVVYAVFTAGHHPRGGDVAVRIDLAEEAIRLARLLHSLVPDEPEAAGLLALLLATHARHRARIDIGDGTGGDVVLMADQDRSLWDGAAIGEAGALVDATLRRRQPGPYQVQAAIACLHGLAPRWEDTDWRQIAELYELLEWFEATPVVRVNRAVAVAEVDGPAAGLAVLADVAGMDAWHLLWSTRAALLDRAGRTTDAAVAYERALTCDCNAADHRFLQRKLAALRS